MENLEKKSLTQKLKQNSKNIFYSLALLIISGLLIAYASKQITSIDNSIKATTGDKITSAWVNAVNDELKYLRENKADKGAITSSEPWMCMMKTPEGNCLVRESNPGTCIKYTECFLSGGGYYYCTSDSSKWLGLSQTISSGGYIVGEGKTDRYCN